MGRYLSSPPEASDVQAVVDACWDHTDGPLEPLRRGEVQALEGRHRHQAARIRRVEETPYHLDWQSASDTEEVKYDSTEDNLLHGGTSGDNASSPPANLTLRPIPTSDDPCKLCGNPKHGPKNCPIFPPGRNQVAAYECRICKSGLYHFNKHCPRSLEDAKN